MRDPLCGAGGYSASSLGGPQTSKARIDLLRRRRAKELRTSVRYRMELSKSAQYLPTVDPMTSSRTDFLNSEILASVPGGHHCVSQGIVVPIQSRQSSLTLLILTNQNKATAANEPNRDAVPRVVPYLS